MKEGNLELEISVTVVSVYNPYFDLFLSLPFKINITFSKHIIFNYLLKALNLQSGVLEEFLANCAKFPQFIKTTILIRVNSVF